MKKEIKQKIKMLLCIFVIIISIYFILKQMNTPIIAVTEKNNNLDNSKIEVSSKLFENYDVKVYEKTEEQNEFIQVKKITNENNWLNKRTTFELETNDITKPNNIRNIKQTITENYIILSFEPAIDNGTNYEYYLESNSNDNTIKTDVKKINSISGIKGYNYVIDTNKNTEAGYEVNKINNDPIVFSNFDWSKNYYLHIRTIDNCNNFSDNLTYKINLPSKGINMQYLDVNSYFELSPKETIIGNVNDEYNIKEYGKKIDGYELIKIEGEQSGKLLKEKINIKYLYAKKANVIVKYCDKFTGKEIAKENNIEGYIGKKFETEVINIKGYKYNSGKVIDNMKENNQEIIIYYDKIANINVSYINEQTGEEIISNDIHTNIIGNTYNIEEKIIPGYELVKVEGQTNGVITKDEINIVFKYKQQAKLVVKYLDIDTNEILEQEIINCYLGDEIIIKPKDFEGYILNDNYEYYNSQNKDNDIQENKEDIEEKESNIIEEIIKEDYMIDEEENENIEEENENIIQQYDILIDCGEKEYIIYYKKNNF